MCVDRALVRVELCCVSSLGACDGESERAGASGHKKKSVGVRMCCLCQAFLFSDSV